MAASHCLLATLLCSVMLVVADGQLQEADQTEEKNVVGQNDYLTYLPDKENSKSNQRTSCFTQNTCLNSNCQKEYVVNNTFKMNWFQGFQHCTRQGWRLATIDSETEEKQLEDILKAGCLSDVWIGATDFADNGRYAWLSTGHPVTFTNWHSGHHRPNPLSWHVPETCVVKKTDGQDFSRWFPEICHNQHYVVCEYFKYNATEERFDIDVRASF